MIVVHRKEGRAKGYIAGKGVIPYPENAVEVEADGKELERILKLAPFLCNPPLYPEHENFIGAEAIAAVLAFNHCEKD